MVAEVSVADDDLVSKLGVEVSLMVIFLVNDRFELLKESSEITSAGLVLSVLKSVNGNASSTISPLFIIFLHHHLKYKYLLRDSKENQRIPIAVQISSFL